MLPFPHLRCLRCFNPPAPLRLSSDLPHGGRSLQGSSGGGVAEPPPHTLAFTRKLGVAHQLALSHSCRHRVGNDHHVRGRLLLRQVRCDHSAAVVNLDSLSLLSFHLMWQLSLFFISFIWAATLPMQCDAKSMLCSLTADWLAPLTLPMGMRKHIKSIANPLRKGKNVTREHHMSLCLHAAVAVSAKTMLSHF